jgi:hypothetical protein
VALLFEESESKELIEVSLGLLNNWPGADAL